MPAAKPADIHAALLAFQADPPALVKSGTNPHLKNRFVPLDEAIDKVTPALNALGVTVLQPLSYILDKPAIRTILTHAASGTYVEDVTPLVLDKVTPQGQGAAITYCRRYFLLSFLNLVGDDDVDAQGIVAQVQQSAPVSQVAMTPATGAVFGGAL